MTTSLQKSLTDIQNMIENKVFSPQEITIAVLQGGTSLEREISLETGKNVTFALQKLGYNVVAIDAVDDFVNKLITLKPDLVFNALHGTKGEDGVVQGMLECLDLPYTGSGVLASSLAMDKMLSKNIWQASNLPVVPGEMYSDGNNYVYYQQKYGDILAVKPVNEGSSIGITKVTDEASFHLALKACKGYSRVMVEQWITGDELAVSVLDDNILPLVRITIDNTKHEFYDYNAKYDGSSNYDVAPNLPDELVAYINMVTLTAGQDLMLSNYYRMDFILDKENNIWLTEANTSPGMTVNSLVPQAAAHLGFSFEQLILLIIKPFILQIIEKQSFKQREMQSSIL